MIGFALLVACVGETVGSAVPQVPPTARSGRPFDSCDTGHPDQPPLELEGLLAASDEWPARRDGPGWVFEPDVGCLFDAPVETCPERHANVADPDVTDAPECSEQADCDAPRICLDGRCLFAPEFTLCVEEVRASRGPMGSLPLLSVEVDEHYYYSESDYRRYRASMSGFGCSLVLRRCESVSVTGYSGLRVELYERNDVEPCEGDALGYGGHVEISVDELSRIVNQGCHQANPAPGPELWVSVWYP